jgi:tetratricopeptide (TPR) repeat protein
LAAAHAEAKRVIVAEPLHPVARMLRARVWVEQDHPDFAIVDLTSLVGRTAGGDARDGIVSALDELVEVPGLTRALTDMQRANALGARGAVLVSLEAWERARSDLEQAVALGANNWMILHALARTYVEHFKTDFERASELAQTALDDIANGLLSTDDDRARVLHTLGMAHLGCGRHDDAAKALRQAASVLPTDEQIAADLQSAEGRGV